MISPRIFKWYANLIPIDIFFLPSAMKCEVLIESNPHPMPITCKWALIKKLRNDMQTICKLIVTWYFNKWRLIRPRRLWYANEMQMRCRCHPRLSFFIFNFFFSFLVCCCFYFGLLHFISFYFIWFSYSGSAFIGWNQSRSNCSADGNDMQMICKWVGKSFPSSPSSINIRSGSLVSYPAAIETIPAAGIVAGSWQDRQPIPKI